MDKVLSSQKTLPTKITKEIFLLALQDFFDNKIDKKNLASVATVLYYDFSKPNSFYRVGENELGAVLEDATEIEYYFERKDSSEREKLAYDNTIEKLRAYLKNNKTS